MNRSGCFTGTVLHLCFSLCVSGRWVSNHTTLLTPASVPLLGRNASSLVKLTIPTARHIQGWGTECFPCSHLVGEAIHDGSLHPSRQLSSLHSPHHVTTCCNAGSDSWNTSCHIQNLASWFDRAMVDKTWAEDYLLARAANFRARHVLKCLNESHKRLLYPNVGSMRVQP